MRGGRTAGTSAAVLAAIAVLGMGGGFGRFSSYGSQASEKRRRLARDYDMARKLGRFSARNGTDVEAFPRDLTTAEQNAWIQGWHGEQEKK